MFSVSGIIIFIMEILCKNRHVYCICIYIEIAYELVLLLQSFSAFLGVENTAMKGYLYIICTIFLFFSVLCSQNADAEENIIEDEYIQIHEHNAVYHTRYGYDTDFGKEHTRSHQTWLDSLSADQRLQAEAIIQKRHTRLHALRDNVCNKLRELQEFSYSENTNTETLARLGKELQDVRELLRKEWSALVKELQQELGVSIPIKRGRGSTNLTVHAFDQFNGYEGESLVVSE